MHNLPSPEYVFADRVGRLLHFGGPHVSFTDLSIGEFFAYGSVDNPAVMKKTSLLRAEGISSNTHDLAEFPAPSTKNLVRCTAVIT